MAEKFKFVFHKPGFISSPYWNFEDKELEGFIQKDIYYTKKPKKRKIGYFIRNPNRLTVRLDTLKAAKEKLIEWNKKDILKQKKRVEELIKKYGIK